MKTRIVCSFAITLISAALSLAGAGSASADDFAGSTYSDASALIAQRNAKAVIETISGSKLALADCIVVSARQSMFLDSSKNGSDRSKEVLLNLNCNAKVAGPGVPGNSAATPEGRQAKKAQTDALYIAGHLDECHKDDKTLTYCKQICDSTKMCEI